LNKKEKIGFVIDIAISFLVGLAIGIYFF